MCAETLSPRTGEPTADLGRGNRRVGEGVEGGAGSVRDAFVGPRLGGRTEGLSRVYV
jgi:hypothetical protein